MKTSILITVSALTLNLMLASAPSFAADASTPMKDLKAQLKTDKAQLKTDIKANGKHSDVVKADRAKVKEDRDAIISKKAKKHMRHPKSPDTTAPAAAVTPPSS